MDIEQRFECAIRDLRAGTYKTPSSAASVYNVPRKDLIARLNGAKPRGSTRPYRVAKSHRTAQPQLIEQVEGLGLSPDRESMLAKWCTDLDDIGCTPDLKAVGQLASLLSRHGGGPDRVGDDWIQSFLERHLEVRVKPDETVDIEETVSVKEENDIEG